MFNFVTYVHMNMHEVGMIKKFQHQQLGKIN